MSFQERVKISSVAVGIHAKNRSPYQSAPNYSNSQPAHVPNIVLTFVHKWSTKIGDHTSMKSTVPKHVVVQNIKNGLKNHSWRDIHFYLFLLVLLLTMQIYWIFKYDVAFRLKSTTTKILIDGENGKCLFKEIKDCQKKHCPFRIGFA